jgi:hypothetical protein
VRVLGDQGGRSRVHEAVYSLIMMRDGFLAESVRGQEGEET